MQRKELFFAIRELQNALKSPYLDALLGLWTVRESDGRNPEDCMYIRMAAEKFLTEGTHLEDFKNIINKLHEELNR